METVRTTSTSAGGNDDFGSDSMAPCKRSNDESRGSLRWAAGTWTPAICLPPAWAVACSQSVTFPAPSNFLKFQHQNDLPQIRWTCNIRNDSSCVVGVDSPAQEHENAHMCVLGLFQHLCNHHHLNSYSNLMGQVFVVDGIAPRETDDITHSTEQVNRGPEATVRPPKTGRPLLPVFLLKCFQCLWGTICSPRAYLFPWEQVVILELLLENQRTEPRETLAPHTLSWASLHCDIEI